MHEPMKAAIWFALASLLLCGCATSTIQSRKQERRAVFASLPPEFQQAVDQGELKVGMTPDAVYIAWGKPAQVFTGQSTEGPTTTWIFTGVQVVQYSYWAYTQNYAPYYATTPTIQYGYGPRQYLRAEVVFVEGRLKSWRKLDPPGGAPPKSKDGGPSSQPQ
jgi:hypothetical protein